MTPAFRIHIRHDACPNGWGPAPCPDTGPYAAGHLCDRDAGHRGRCRCTCGSIGDGERLVLPNLDEPEPNVRRAVADAG